MIKKRKSNVEFYFESVYYFYLILCYLVSNSDEIKMEYSTPTGITNLQFNPDKYPHATLKAFNEFIEQYEFRYIAQYPVPPKNAVDNEVEKWKANHRNEEISNDTIETIHKEWVSKDKVRKLLHFFSIVHL